MTAGTSGGVRTSVSHPIDVAWLNAPGITGRVGLTLAPGKHAGSKEGSAWRRDLDADLDRLRETWGVQVLVCLLEDDELHRLRIARLPDAARARGMKVHRLPIPDGGLPPSARDVEGTVDTIVSAARAGEHVLVHCMGGLGRAGTIGGCVLRALGVDAERTLAELRRARGPRCPENELQRAFIRRFR